MANSVDPDQTAPIGAVCSWSTLFASIKLVSNIKQLFAADDLNRRHFQMHFFLGALRVNPLCILSLLNTFKSFTDLVYRYYKFIRGGSEAV